MVAHAVLAVAMAVVGELEVAGAGAMADDVAGAGADG